jgi:hypothetical protein
MRANGLHLRCPLARVEHLPKGADVLSQMRPTGPRPAAAVLVALSVGCSATSSPPHPADTLDQTRTKDSLSGHELPDLDQEGVCSDSCPVAKQVRCAGGSRQICDDFHHDGCLQWGNASPCPLGLSCISGACTCVPDCTRKTCGGCAGECGSCQGGWHCDRDPYDGDDLYHQCEPCIPACDGLKCGPDGCGGTCGECTDVGPDGCVCDSPCMALSCLDRECGPAHCPPGCFGDSAGPCASEKDCPAGTECEPAFGICVACAGGCGSCPEGETCSPEYHCIPAPDPCEGKTCGPDGSGGSCGECAPPATCVAGLCVPADSCFDACLGKQCGVSPCGDSCGTCPPGSYCDESGYCMSCEWACWNRGCGKSECGTDCGKCDAGWCLNGRCLPWGGP